jgi:hypothetical protein
MTTPNLEWTWSYVGDELLRAKSEGGWDGAVTLLVKHLRARGFSDADLDALWRGLRAHRSAAHITAKRMARERLPAKS